MKNTTNTVRTICEIGIFAALGFVFDELQGAIFAGVFQNGGSIGFAMIAVLIIAYRRGVLPGVITGLIMGLFDLMSKVYIYHPVQLFLDYIFPYALVGLAGFFKPLFDKAETKQSKIGWLLVGTVVGGLLKFFSHYLSGVIFFADSTKYPFAWGLSAMNPFIYCFIYNIAFVGPSIIITGALLTVVFVVYPKTITDKAFVNETDSNSKNYLPAVISTLLIAAGSFLFTFYLIKYINSFEFKEKTDHVKIAFEKDSMVIFLIGLFVFILGVICLFMFFKNKSNYLLMSASSLVISVVSLVYCIAQLIDSRGKENSYWIWFIAATVSLILVSAFFVVVLVFRKRKKQL